MIIYLLVKFLHQLFRFWRWWLFTHCSFLILICLKIFIANSYPLYVWLCSISFISICLQSVHLNTICSCFLAVGVALDNNNVCICDWGYKKMQGIIGDGQNLLKKIANQGHCIFSCCGSHFKIGCVSIEEERSAPTPAIGNQRADKSNIDILRWLFHFIGNVTW